MTRRSATKKSMTELTDSGVSVVSDAPPSSKDIRLLSWLKESDKKADIKHSRHGKKYGSRSGSLERTNRETWGVPAQPFVTDPGMPLLPQPHTVNIFILSHMLFISVVIRSSDIYSVLYRQLS